MVPNATMEEETDFRYADRDKRRKTTQILNPLPNFHIANIQNIEEQKPEMIGKKEKRRSVIYINIEKTLGKLLCRMSED